MSKGSGTRSGLLWEVERLLKECKELGTLPEVLLMENVPQVHSKKNKADWDMWLKALEEMGYKNFYQDLNSKNYGIAQNRNRTYMISLLQGEYIFPEEIELTSRLKDYLEDKVDEKYYINNDKAYSLIVDLINRGVLSERERERGFKKELTSQQTTQQSEKLQTASRQHKEELQTLHKMSSVLLSQQGTKFERFTDIAGTIMARDWKGFGNQAMNGVIESE